MNSRLADAFDSLPDYLSQHVLLSVCALALALAVSLPLALVSLRSPHLRGPILGFASAMQTIPGLALMALFYPLLLLVSAGSEKMFGWSVSALGFLPALLALTLYALLPILRNAVTAVEGIDPAVRQAALAVGMTQNQMLWQVEAPLAAPFIMAGIRTAVVWTIGAATLATPVGQTSLGNYIFSGLQTENWVSVVFGCVISAAVALTADALLGLVEEGMKQRSRMRIMAGAVGLVAGALAALSPVAANMFTAGRPVVIGAKNFSEQFILAELISQRLEGAGLRTQIREGLGSAIVFRALAAGDIDVYVDYTGTLWTNVMQRQDKSDRETMYRQIVREMRERFGILVLGRLGFENAYAMVMRGERARELNIGTIAELAGRASSLTFGTDLEFLQRPEWKTLRDAYGLDFSATRTYAPTFMYRALTGSDVDVITGFSSDGRIAAEKLKVLEDSKGAIPAYDAIILVSPRRAKDTRVLAALRPLIGAIKVEAMREANHAVDRDANKLSPQEAARQLARQSGL